MSTKELSLLPRWLRRKHDLESEDSQYTLAMIPSKVLLSKNFAQKSGSFLIFSDFSVRVCGAEKRVKLHRFY